MVQCYKAYEVRNFEEGCVKKGGCLVDSDSCSPLFLSLVAGMVWEFQQMQQFKAFDWSTFSTLLLHDLMQC